MEEFYNFTLENTNCTDSDNTNCNDSDTYDYDYNVITPNTLRPTYVYVMERLIIATGLPLTLVAIYSIYSLVRKDHVAPIYVINLLISDLIQLCCMIVETFDIRLAENFYIYYFTMLASIGFMVCISMERYLVVAWPVWYRFRRNIKTTVAVCVVVWILPLVYILPVHFKVNYIITETIFGVYLLLPLPLFIFFMVETCKALSTSRVPSDEKRRIVAILIVVLLIYTLLFLPNAVWSLATEFSFNGIFTNLSFLFLKLSPLADLFFYVFIRKGAVDKLLSSLCCCGSDSNDVSRPTDQEYE